MADPSGMYGLDWLGSLVDTAKFLSFTDFLKLTHSQKKKIVILACEPSEKDAYVEMLYDWLVTRPTISTCGRGDMCRFLLQYAKDTAPKFFSVPDSVSAKRKKMF